MRGNWEGKEVRSTRCTAQLRARKIHLKNTVGLHISSKFTCSPLIFKVLAKPMALLLCFILFELNPSPCISVYSSTLHTAILGSAPSFPSLRLSSSPALGDLNTALCSSCLIHRKKPVTRPVTFNLVFEPSPQFLSKIPNINMEFLLEEFLS